MGADRDLFVVEADAALLVGVTRAGLPVRGTVYTLEEAGPVDLRRRFEEAMGRRNQKEGRPVALFNIDGTYYAIDVTCTHRGGSLSEGAVEGTTVTCPLHGATTGNVLGPPASEGVAHYNVQVDGNDIKVETP